AQSDTFEDGRFGFRVKFPKKWEPIPIQTGEGWLVAKYLSDKTYFFTSDGWAYEFKPEMLVVAFLSDELVKRAEKAARERAEQEREKEAEEGGDDEEGGDEGGDEGGGGGEGGEEGDEPELPDEVLIDFGRRYKDYKDYLASTYQGGGYYFTVEEPGEHEGLRVTRYEVKVEKNASSGPKRIATWVYHLPDVDIAVQFEVLEDSYDKLARTLQRSFESLRVVPRTASLPTEQASANSTIRISIGDLEKLTPEERRKKRQLSEAQEHAKALANLTEGWRSERMGQFLVLSHADPKYDRRVAEQAGAVFEFLADTFPYVGAEEYVRAPILRICKDLAEEQSFRGGQWWTFNNLEITTNKEGGGTRSFEFRWMNQMLVNHWFYERDFELWSGMPEWLQNGIVQLVSESTNKGGKLDFYRDDFTRETLRELVRDGRSTPARDLMHMTSEDFFGAGGESAFDRAKEAQALVAHLLVGGGAKGRTKDLVHDYMQHLMAVVGEQSKQGLTGVEEAPETEAEEEALLRRRKDAWRNRERALIDEVSRRAFGDWTEQDWDKLDKEFQRAL
ncbi:MAG TPA: hypothetical protein VJP77_00565, partial [Planctomycetota bacterium]|nr:hypothetical protein [Planctomycetota bacterium]